MSFPYFDETQLRARIGSEIVDQLLDDNRDGVADPTPVDRLRKDASVKVADGLPNYSREELAALTGDNAEGVTRVALDFAEAYAAKRHREVMRVDWEPLMKFAKDELADLRKTMSKLPTPTDPSNEGTRTSSGNPDDPEPKPRFTDNWGCF